MATKTDGTLWIWGGQNYGNLGINAPGSRSSPIQIPGTNWNRILANKTTSFATKTDGTLWAWGDQQDNPYGQLGLNDAISRSSPTQIPGTDWIQPVGGGNGKSAGCIRTDGTLWMWGWNRDGRLGLNNDADGGFNYSSPTQVPGTWATGINQSASSSYSPLVIKP
tara:strand:- start:41 stop:535 length:495 start_codon:yes stop_codon:yes gene_type:complete